MRITSEHVYQAAKQGSLLKLRAALSFVAIDLYQQGTFESALTRLAKEADLAAVDFLLRYGAENNFAVLGAVMSSDTAWQDMFLSLEKSASTMIAKGFAQAGNRKLAETLIELGAHPAIVVFGAALGKQFDWVDSLLLKFKNPICVSMAGKGAAMVRDRRRIDEYRAQGASIDVIAQGIGISGDAAYAEVFAKENPDCRNALAMGFATSGCRRLSMHFCGRKNVNPVLFGAAMRGDKAWVEELKKYQHIKLQCVFIGAVLGGHLQWAESLRHDRALRSEKIFLKSNHARLITLEEKEFFESARLMQAVNMIGYPSNHVLYASPALVLPEVVSFREIEKKSEPTEKVVFFPPIRERNAEAFSRHVYFQTMSTFEKEDSEARFSLSK